MQPAKTLCNLYSVLSIYMYMYVFCPIPFEFFCSIFLVNSLSVQQSSSKDDVEATVGPDFRWDYICIYSLLVFLRGGGSGRRNISVHIQSYF